MDGLVRHVALAGYVGHYYLYLIQPRSFTACRHKAGLLLRAELNKESYYSILNSTFKFFVPCNMATLSTLIDVNNHVLS